MKATPALRARVEEAARESGLSIAQEVERRLIASIEFDAMHGGPRTADLLRRLAMIIADAEREAGGKWDQDFAAYEAVRAAIPAATNNIMSARMPMMPNEREVVGLQLAADETEEIMSELRTALVAAGIIPQGTFAEIALGIDEKAIETSPTGESRTDDERASLRAKLTLYRQAQEVARKLKTKKDEALKPVREQQRRSAEIARQIVHGFDADELEE
jgi:hypothetical protein